MQGGYVRVLIKIIEKLYYLVTVCPPAEAGTREIHTDNYFSGDFICSHTQKLCERL